MSVSEAKQPSRAGRFNELIQRLREFWRETRSELRKVVWPTRTEATNLTIIVLSVLIGMAILLGSLDAVYNLLFGFLFR